MSLTRDRISKVQSTAPGSIVVPESKVHGERFGRCESYPRDFMINMVRE